MLNDYLQYAKTQVQEESLAVNIDQLFKEIKSEINSKKFNYKSNDNETILIARKNALKRCFNNVIQNGLLYGGNVYVKLTNTKSMLIINIEDDGPGIPEDQYKNVFKPFFRLDKSRNFNKSGVGLGLSISEDIINSHGGNIRLLKSEFNGLLVKISLPF
jgi:two-component system osmolarity sensor histidine kinase EnvZ